MREIISHNVCDLSGEGEGGKRAKMHTSGETVPMISFSTPSKRPVEMRSVGDLFHCLRRVRPPRLPRRRLVIRAVILI
jgi:hypothetical protein